MKEKQLKIMAGVFVALLVFYFLTKPRPKAVNLDEFVQTIVFGVAADDVEQVEIYKESGGESVRMVFAKQDDEGWITPTHHNAKVKEDQIERLLEDVTTMTGKVRTSNPEHFDKFDISDITGIHLLLKDPAEKPLANLIIGKRGEDTGSGFVRFAGQEKVFFSDKNLLSTLGIYGNIDTLSSFNHSRFVDLQAVDQNKEDLNMIRLVNGREEVQVEKVDKEVEEQQDTTTVTRIKKIWTLKKGERNLELEESELNDFLRDVTRIRASKVVDHIGGSLMDMNKQSQYGVGRSNRGIIMKGKDGEQYRIIFGNQAEDEARYMFVEVDGLVYELSKSTYDKIMKWTDELPEKVKS